MHAVGQVTQQQRTPEGLFTPGQRFPKLLLLLAAQRQVGEAGYLDVAAGTYLHSSRTRQPENKGCRLPLQQCQQPLCSSNFIVGKSALS